MNRDIKAPFGLLNWGISEKLTNAVAENGAYDLPIVDSFAEADGADHSVVGDGAGSHWLRGKCCQA